MKIKRELEYARWEYDTDNGVLDLSFIDTADPERPDMGRLSITRKAYAYSLARFLIRVFQSNSRKKKTIKKIKPTIPVNQETLLSEPELTPSEKSES